MTAAAGVLRIFDGRRGRRRCGQVVAEVMIEILKAPEAAKEEGKIA